MLDLYHIFFLAAIFLLTLSLGSFIKQKNLILVYALYIIFGFLYFAFGIFVFKKSFQYLVHKDILLHFPSIRFVFMPSTLGLYSICTPSLYGVYDRYTILVFSISEQVFLTQSTKLSIIPHCCEASSLLFSSLSGPTSGLHILFLFFFFPICLLLWQKHTYEKCYGSDAHEWTGANSQCLFATLSGTRGAPFLKISLRP